LYIISNRDISDTLYLDQISTVKLKHFKRDLQQFHFPSKSNQRKSIPSSSATAVELLNDGVISPVTDTNWKVWNYRGNLTRVNISRPWNSNENLEDSNVKLKLKFNYLSR